MENTTNSLLEEITEYLMNKLSYAYCDNCGNDSDFSCQECHRKYQSWRLGEPTATEIAIEIIELMRR